MRKGGIAYLAFTERGRALAERLRGALGGAAACTRDGARLREWTAEQFANARALVYIGAAGIAVRAIAPHLTDKASDPAVVCVDERGRFAIPLASGHLGGANELARRIAGVLGATAVVTTATDVNGVFAVDEWARVQNMSVPDPARVRAVSAKLLGGAPVTLRTAFPIDGEPPEGVIAAADGEPDVWVDVRPHDALTLAPRALLLGVGCRRGTPGEAIEARFASFCRAHGVLPEAVCAVATIDLKNNEDGLRAFCAAHDWPMLTWTAEELACAAGEFTASDFVASRVGVDNVCERAAVLAAGEGGTLLARKDAGNGVTLALAQRPLRLDWRWQNG